MHKRWPTILVLAILAVCVAGGIACYVLGLGGSTTAAIEVPEAYADRITAYDDGDFTINISTDDIAYDREQGTVYIEGLLTVYLAPDLSDSERLELAGSVGGTIVSNVTGGADVIEVIVPGADLDTLNSYAAELGERNEVLYASYAAPLSPSSHANYADTNPWALSYVVPTQVFGRESSPSGENWWAEEIRAYTAWSYDELFGPVAVGIIDDGFDFDHEDLDGSIELADGFYEHTEADHGTSVASIIGAHDNEVGLRGVAGLTVDGGGAELFCVDWSPRGDDPNEAGFVSVISPAEFSHTLEQLVCGDNGEQPIRVVNCSWGYNIVSERGYKQDKDLRNTFSSYKDYLEAFDTSANDSRGIALVTLVSLLQNDADVLIVESAGNGYDNDAYGSAPAPVEYTGYFNAIDEDLFNALFSRKTDLAWWGDVTYDDVNMRILTVAASQLERADDGSGYLLAPYSNYGDAVDIAAPGGVYGEDEIYCACVSGYSTEYGTSCAAPMVTGAAALLWSCDPSLTAPAVRDLLLAGCSRVAQPSHHDQTGSYPLLDVGASLELLIDQRGGLARGLSIEVVDAQSGKPIEEAYVTLHDYDALLGDDPSNSDIYNIDSNELDRRLFYEELTDENGLAVCTTDKVDGVDDTSADASVVVCVEAEGYRNWISLEPTRLMLADGAPVHTLTIELEPESSASDAQASADELISAKVEELANSYGIIQVGTELFSYEGTGSANGTLVPSDRLEGLLSAERHDYDGDGQDELLTVRLDTRGGWSTSDDGAWTPVDVVISMYEATDTDMELADEVTATTEGLPDCLPVSSFHIFRYEAGEYTWLFFDFAANFNDQMFGTFALRYDGSSFTLETGVSCTEHYSQAISAQTTDLSALADPYAPMPGSDLPASWEGSYTTSNWEDSGTPDADDLESYFEFYDVYLAPAGLVDERPRSYFTEESLAEPYDADNPYWAEWLLPAEHFSSMSGEPIVEICGVISVMPTAASGDSGVQLTCYDNGELLR